ncbi:hypothetical protein VaNZ11_002994 [Volvox africanus]|uniref:Uncharacterized protein n=1 Tax=Volvox africanus TaxID=51714 RepID=A0ABQ5RU44_9CHLO|nr:hypothetical protein VaNZ11_002994 [Volvox africanus]
MSRRPCGMFLCPDDSMDFLPGTDSLMLRTGSDGNTGVHIISCQEMLLAVSRLSDDGVQQPDKALGFPHRLGLSSSNTSTSSIGLIVPVDRIIFRNPGQLCLSSVGPKAGSIGNVHHADCGSVQLADLLTFGDTSSSFNLVSMSSCDSQSELADLSQAAYPGLTGRPSLVPFHPPFTPLGCDNDYLQSDMLLEEGRHHGGDDAATALRNESARLRSAVQDSKSVNCTTTSHALPNPLGNESLLVRDKSTDGGLNHSSGSQEHSVEAYAARLFEAADIVDADTATELLTATITPGRWQCSSWVGSTGVLPDDGEPFEGTASLQMNQRSFSGGLLSASMSEAEAGFCRPICWMKSEAEACATRTPSGSPSGGHWAIFAASGVAPDQVFTPSAPQSMPQSSRATVLQSSGAAVTETGMEMSPFATHAYEGFLMLDHELPDDSVHGGKPRHPSLPAAQPCDNLLLEWAEAITNGMHRTGRAESGTFMAAPCSTGTPATPSAVRNNVVGADRLLVAQHCCWRPRLRDPQLQLKTLRTASIWMLLPVLAQRVLLACLLLPVLVMRFAVLQPLAACGWRLLTLMTLCSAVHGLRSVEPSSPLPDAQLRRPQPWTAGQQDSGHYQCLE